MDFDKLDRGSIVPANTDAWLLLRTQDITSTEVPALFGLSPYATQFELWHQKKNKEVVSIPDNDRLLWGKRLQEVIARGVADDEGWDIRPRMEYGRIPSLRIGSSFDYEARSTLSHEPFLLEIKNVDSLISRDNWTKTEFGIEAPAHIELQVQHQMLVAGIRKAVIGALVGGNRVMLLHREYDPDVGAGIIAACADFWRSIDANEPPAPDFRRDAEAIRKIYNYAEPGKLFDATGNAQIDGILRRYYDAQRIESNAKLDKAEASAELLTLIGDAEKVNSDNFKVSCGMVGPADISYHREGYRNFRCTPKKESK